MREANNEYQPDYKQGFYTNQYSKNTFFRARRYFKHNLFVAIFDYVDNRFQDK
jgi:hypothetical protein